MRTLTAITILAGIGVALCCAQTEDRVELRPIKDLRGSRGAVQHVLFHPDGKHLISVADDAKITFWDIEGRAVARRLFPREREAQEHLTVSATSRRIEDLAISPDGKILAEAAVEPSQETILRFWDPESGAELRVFTRNEPNMRCVLFTPDGKYVITNQRDPVRWAYKILIREVETGKTVAELDEKRLASMHIAISHDGRLLATAGGTKIHIWNLDTRKLAHEIDAHEKGIQSIDFSPSGKLLVSGSADDTLRIWRVDTGKSDREIKAEQDGVTAVAYSPSGNLIVSGGRDKTIKVWKARSGFQHGRLWGHVGPVECIAFNKDGSLLASGGRDALIALWDIGPLEETAAEDGADQKKQERDDWD